MKRSILACFLVAALAGCTEDDAYVPDPNIVADIDGNVYHAVTIGTQVWMLEDLRAMRLNDGTSLPYGDNGSSWSRCTVPAYCWYGHSAENGRVFGALYNWHAVATGKLAPAGWHVATDADWSILIQYLGGEGVAGGALKDTGTVRWRAPNRGATNGSGFTALPGGYRNEFGYYLSLGDLANWWTTSSHDATYAWLRFVNFSTASAGRDFAYKTRGASVRCVKD